MLYFFMRFRTPLNRRNWPRLVGKFPVVDFRERVAQQFAKLCSSQTHDTDEQKLVPEYPKSVLPKLLIAKNKIRKIVTSSLEADESLI